MAAAAKWLVTVKVTSPVIARGVLNRPSVLVAPWLFVSVSVQRAGVPMLAPSRVWPAGTSTVTGSPGVSVSPSEQLSAKA